MTRPIEGVKGCRYVASFDLKSATDRWARYIMWAMVISLFGLEVAVSIVEYALGSAPVTLGVGP